MEGRLAGRPPAEILSEIQRRQASGILRYQNDQIIRQMFIDSGTMVRFAASTLPAESMTSLFRQTGGITDDQLRDASDDKQSHELLGTTLVRLEMMTRQALADLTQEHIRRVAHGAFLLTEGTFQFQQGALPYREQLDSGMRSSELLLEWARDVPDIEWIRRRLGSLEAQIQMSSRPPEGYQAVSLNPAEGYTMSRVDGTASLREICIVSPMGEETTLRALFSLVLAGIIEIPAGSEIPAGPFRASRAQAAPQPTAKAPTSGPVQAAPAPRQPTGKEQAAAPPQPTGKEPAAARAPEAARHPTTGAAAAGTRAAPESPTPTAPAPKPTAGSPTRSAVLPGRMPGNGGAPKPTAPRKVTNIKERVRRATPPRKPTVAPAPARTAGSSNLEAEMLDRFQRIHDQSLYDVLNVTTGESADNLRRAYYTLAKKFHPDKFKRDEIKTKAEKVFAHITEAYSTLNKTETRKKYDEELAYRSHPKTQSKEAGTESLAKTNFNHGKKNMAEGKYAEALSFLQNACDQDPSKAEYWYYLGLTQSKNPRWKKDTEASLLKSLKIDPTRADAYALLGSVYAKGRLFNKAREMFEKALQWDPTQELAQTGLAEIEAGGKKGLLGMFKK